MAIKIDQIKSLKNTEQWAEQIVFWRTHLDVFIEEYFKVKLKDTQKVVARNFGNCSNMNVVKSRGYGKTWLIALCCLALGVLYPGTFIAVVSGTAKQATLILDKINSYFIKYEDILREIDYSGRSMPVYIAKDKAVCKLKNRSKIESYAIASMRGVRAKIIVSDESPEIKKDQWEAIASPVKNTKRDVCHTHGIPDFASKTISITSACLKSNYFFSDFMQSLKEMEQGNREYFACALDYRSAMRIGITDEAFFEEERKRLPDITFSMEYGSMFVGEEADSLFPYDLTETCRTLKHVEYRMPKNSKSEYVMSVDIATSARKEADNTIVTIIKMAPKSDGTIHKQLVYIRSYHGVKMSTLCEEIRKTYVRFPNIVKIVFDQRGLGDSFPEFFKEPWVDAITGKEYPPWHCDDERSMNMASVPLLRSIKANPAYNQQLVTCMRVALEQRTIAMPIGSRAVLGGELEDGVGEEGESLSKRKTKEEMAIYLEADATQVEMGNVVARRTEGGTFVYDVAKRGQQHKDRYSSLAMNVKYISELEEVLKRKYRQRINGVCVGIVSGFGERR